MTGWPAARRRWVVWASALCVALPAAAQSGASPARPRTGTPERQEIRAQLSPKRYTTLAAEIGARIAKLPVAEGGAFRAGQTLVSFDCALQSAQLDRARAEVSGAEKTFAANQRMKELNSIGQSELDLSRATLDKAIAELAAARAVVSKCVIAAPFGGRVAEQKAREGQYAQPGQALLDILDDSSLELEFLVPSMWMVWLKTGHGFEVRIDETGKSYPARVTRIGARVDPVSQSVKVVATIDNKYPELIAGMSGLVLIAPPPAK